MSIDFERLTRYLLRCKEVADEPGMNPIVAAVYKEALDGAGDAEGDGGGAPVGCAPEMPQTA